MGQGHEHARPTAGNERSLWIALALTSAFLVAEVVGGVLTKSLALISDAAHMFTDVAALAIALAAVRVARRPADDKRSFGYHRFEILAAAFNALLLFAVAIYIVFEAWQRLRNPPEVESAGMLAIAVLGLVVNLVSMRLLAGGKDASLNVKGAYLEVWSDMLGSIGVIVGAIVIRFTGWTWVDSVVAVGIGLWVLPRTWVLLKESINILLEGTPEGVDVSAVRRTIAAVAGVGDMHDLHIWALSSGKTSLSVHIVVAEGAGDREIVRNVRRELLAQHDIGHTTIQCDTAPDIADEELTHWQDGGRQEHEHGHALGGGQQPNSAAADHVHAPPSAS